MSVGQRRSFDGHRCTIRYVGTVEGTTGDWLGVEWDDPTRGKHAGEHKGTLSLPGKSHHSTAGSFVRPSRPSDPPRGFVEALRDKYASEFEQELARHASAEGEGDAGQKNAIEISGKVVEEVGFDKIRKQLAELAELRIVLLDGMCVVGVLPSYEPDQSLVEQACREIMQTCPKIIELDLSRSLLSRWRDVWQICDSLNQLKRLRLSGNRFQPLEEGFIFEGITELHLEDTLLTWDEIAALTSRFPVLTSLTVSANELVEITRPLPSSTITTLTLEHNDFTSLSTLHHLTSLPNLQHLSLRGNNIGTIQEAPLPPSFHFPPTLRSLDLSRNNIPTWTFINILPTIFPGLTTLRLSGNPLYEQPPLPPSLAESSAKPMTVDEAFMLTLSRLPPSLTTLNYSPIKPNDRANAEMYYLSLIAKELSATPADEEQAVLAAHPRYSVLCDQYGEPRVLRATVSDSSSGRIVHPRSVAARLVKMAFYLPSSSSTAAPTATAVSSTEKTGDDNVSKNAPSVLPDIRIKEIPSSFDTYQIKALVSRLFGLRPYSFRLVWETDEWDPVDGDGDGEDGDAGDWDESSEDGGEAEETPQGTGRFVRREVELVDSTRDIGFLVQGVLFCFMLSRIVNLRETQETPLGSKPDGGYIRAPNTHPVY
ncbi:hypothetical protein N7474_006750 [Penicillium riverlandense]|uniref:uncharacterized protein n=1 Tax=Penicillium riverlandense TaxID=1903569 RepID=UPI00254833A7|nr:uncharacterized protein N7474_006750 [Penicillium riverlandense]KAJ5814973.1 hypothetical protein N7474_006750 [Penicillium riverlandense]